MNFDNFRGDLESKLTGIVEFELQEFCFQPYSFGNGLLAYRINGKIHMFTFDGRENELTWSISKTHQKYLDAEFIELKRITGLKISDEEFQSEIKNCV